MTKHSVFVTVPAICLLTAMGLSALFAADKSPADWNAIQKSYAAANLELAQVRLALALDEKSSLGGSLSQDTLDSLEVGVELAQEQLAELNKGTAANPFAPQIAAAEKSLRGLEAQHKASIESNKLAAAAVSDLELRREVAEISVAKARLAALKSLASQPPEVRMQWEISQLQDQIRALWARPLIED